MFLNILSVRQGFHSVQMQYIIVNKHELLLFYVRIQ